MPAARYEAEALLAHVILASVLAALPRVVLARVLAVLTHVVLAALAHGVLLGHFILSHTIFIVRPPGPSRPPGPAPPDAPHRRQNVPVHLQ